MGGDPGDTSEDDGLIPRAPRPLLVRYSTHSGDRPDEEASFPGSSGTSMSNEREGSHGRVAYCGGIWNDDVLD